MIKILYMELEEKTDKRLYLLLGNKSRWAGLLIVTLLVLVRVDPARVQQHHEVIVPQTALAAVFN